MRLPNLVASAIVATETLLACAIAFPASSQPVSKGGSQAVRSAEAATSGPIDFVNATARPLPVNKHFSATALKRDLVASLKKTGSLDSKLQFSRYRKGDGVTLAASPSVGSPASAKASASKEDSGTANLPYSTARADLDPSPTNTQWPYRAAGKLFFRDGAESYVCTASLIGPGLVVTAAHCVAEFGKNRLFSDWTFIPGYRDGATPFGVWEAAKVYVLDGYPAGTAPCQYGVVCKDDVAVIVLKSRMDVTSNKQYYAGERTGWFAYVSGPASFTATGSTHITQLGYPVCLDNGGFMERNDAQGAVSAGNHNNTVFGSLMCGGSSGGPWIVNFGVEPALTDTIPGTFAKSNVVVGVTSWGSTDKHVKQQGASPFLNTNIDALAKAACKEHPAACVP